MPSRSGGLSPPPFSSVFFLSLSLSLILLLRSFNQNLPYLLPFSTMSNWFFITEMRYAPARILCRQVGLHQISCFPHVARDSFTWLIRFGSIRLYIRSQDRRVSTPPRIITQEGIPVSNQMNVRKESANLLTAQPHMVQGKQIIQSGSTRLVSPGQMVRTVESPSQIRYQQAMQTTPKGSFIVNTQGQ